MALCPALAGYFMDRRLLAWPLVLGIGCYVVAAAWFYLTLRRTPLPEEAATSTIIDHEAGLERLALAPDSAAR